MTYNRSPYEEVMDKENIERLKWKTRARRTPIPPAAYPDLADQFSQLVVDSVENAVGKGE